MTTPKASGRECITHHHACDCREARVAKLVEALDGLVRRLDAHFGGPQHISDWKEQEDARAALDEWRRP